MHPDQELTSARNNAQSIVDNLDPQQLTHLLTHQDLYYLADLAHKTFNSLIFLADKAYKAEQKRIEEASADTLDLTKFARAFRARGQ
jgi:hypothetical protein